MGQLSGDGRRRSGATPALTEPRTVQLTAPGYLVEQLAALRPRLDRLIAVTGTVATPPDSPLRRLETTLNNVRAGVDMTIDTIADNFPYQHALLPAVHGNQRRPAVQATTDGYERVRRPNRGGVIRRCVKNCVVLSTGYPPPPKKISFYPLPSRRQQVISCLPIRIYFRFPSQIRVAASIKYLRCVICVKSSTVVLFKVGDSLWWPNTPFTLMWLIPRFCKYFVGGRLRLTCRRSWKVYVLIAVNTVPSRSSRYICGTAA